MRDHVVRFLLQYFSLYDGPSGEETRKCLIEAYDPTVRFNFIRNAVIYHLCFRLFLRIR